MGNGGMVGFNGTSQGDPGASGVQSGEYSAQEPETTGKTSPRGLGELNPELGNIGDDPILQACVELADTKAAQAEAVYSYFLENWTTDFLEAQKMPQESQRIAATAAIFLKEGMKKAVISIAKRIGGIGGPAVVACAVMQMPLIVCVSVALISVILAVLLTASEVNN